MKLPGVALILSFLLAACAGATGSGQANDDPVTTSEAVAPITAETVVTTEETDPTTRSTEPPVPTTADATVPSCGAEGGVELRADATVTLEPLAAVGDVTLFAAEYPLPGPTGGLWSQWGQGIVSSVDGHHYSALGDHLGPDGNSYIYEYDPTARSLTRVVDVLSLTDHQPGAWGYGKVHSQMVEGACGSIWTFTYWGTRSDIRYGNGYEGDLLLEIDPGARTVRNHGALVGERGVPSLIATPDGRYLVGESVEAETDDGELVVVDTETASVVHTVDDANHVGFRSLALEPTGNVIYSVDDMSLMSLEPASGETSDTGIDLPGEEPEFLRAATPVAPDGTFYGVNQYGYEIFAVTGDGSLDVIGHAEEYTASLAMTPEGDRLFWMPGAHGDSWQLGGSILELDTLTGETTEVVSLLEPFEEAFGLLPGGTYSITYHDGSLIVGVNASPLDDDSGFGTVVLVVIEDV